MRLKWTLGILLIAVLHIVICQRGGPSDNTDETFDVSAANLELVSNSVTNLAQRISLAMKDNNNAKTEIFSPVSIAGALSLLLLGAGGVTKNEIMSLMGFQNQQISFADIHRSFGKLFSELVSNEPTLQANIPWRENDKCNIPDDYDDEDVGSRGSFQQHRGTAGRPKRDTDNSVETAIGNGIFNQIGQKFNQKYLRLAEKLYNGNFSSLDFNDPRTSIAFINDWVRTQTRGKIPEIVSQLDADTVLVIANTLYFKGEWQEPFIKGGTIPRKFFPNGPKQPGKDIPMMAHGGCFPYYDWQQAKTRVLGIPYKRNYTMYVFLPVDSDRSKLKDLRSRMNVTAINDIINRMTLKTASVQFPKMQVLNSFNLKDILEQLGASSMFETRRSDLQRILEGYIDNRADGDIFDQLEDTKEKAIQDLHEAFPGCPHQLKDVDTKQQCLKSDRCRYGSQQCVCCAKQGYRKRRTANSDRKKRASKFAPVIVNEVIHKVNLMTNEKGTEAGAVTATLLDRNAPEVNFRTNGPFMLLIRDETTRLPLFYGNIYDL